MLERRPGCMATIRNLINPLSLIVNSIPPDKNASSYFAVTVKKKQGDLCRKRGRISTPNLHLFFLFVSLKSHPVRNHSLSKVKWNCA
jgi:hypothetical protein